MGGVCQTMTGDGTICSPCTTSSECGGSSDFCLGYPDGRGYCGRSCGSDADCGGDRCVNTSGGPQCVRFSGSTPTCTASSGGCTRDSDCGSDQICSGGSCVPRPATGNELGEGCAADADCRPGCAWRGPARRAATG
ncbi:MAG: hypothetical protein M5U28_53590 [Sandaracinaceae bacterium]|nr:hypothetical protein [Sandaracinaceae bacterium]